MDVRFHRDCPLWYCGMMRPDELNPNNSGCEMIAELARREQKYGFFMVDVPLYLIALGNESDVVG